MKSESVINQSRMKQQNRTSVIYALWKNAPISRTGLAKVTGLNKATITSIVASLEDDCPQRVAEGKRGAGAESADV